MKFACALDRMLQTFLTKCIDRAFIAQIDPSFHDMSFLTSMIQHQRFTGMLPPCLMESANPKFMSENKENKHAPRRTATAENDKDKRHVKSSRQQEDW